MLRCCCDISLHAIHSPMKRMLRALVSFTSIVLSASALTYKGTNDKIEDESEETAAGQPAQNDSLCHTVQESRMGWASWNTAAGHGL
jgi:hypothetical protein